MDAQTTIDEARDALLAELRELRGRDARTRYIIQSGKSAMRIPANLRTDEHRVEGCVAASWMIVDRTAGRIHLGMDSEAVMVRGIMSMLQRVYDGRTIDEIHSLSPSFLAEVGILDTISASRRNGISHICQKLQSL